MKLLEHLYIRLLNILHYLSPRKMYICPPKCSEGHTYRWPCQMRIRPPKQTRKTKKHYRYLGD